MGLIGTNPTSPADVRAEAAGPSAAGHGEFVVENVRGQPTITRQRACTPLKLIAPRSGRNYASVFVGSYGGGLVGGDQIDLQMTLHPNTICFASTQASTKVYRNTVDRPARQRLHASVADNALLLLAPDPLTCFADASYEQTQRFNLAPRGNLLLVDWLTSGRHQRGERWVFTRYLSRNDVYVDGKHRLADALLLDPADGPLDAPFRLGKHECTATVTLIGPMLATIAERLRDAVDAEPMQNDTLLEAASPIESGIVWRLLATTTEAIQRRLRQRLAPVTDLLNDDPWRRKW